VLVAATVAEPAMLRLSKSTVRPVAGIPMKSPVWVPVARTDQATWSPSPIKLSTSQWMSGNPAHQVAMYCLNPFRSRVPCGVSLVNSGSNNSSTNSSFPSLMISVNPGGEGAEPATDPAPVASRGGPGSRSSRTVFEVERTVGKNGIVSLGNETVLAAEILAGRRVGIYIEEGAPLLFFDPKTRELLRSRPNPLRPGEASKLQQARPVGPVPRRTTEPIRVQRRASNTGIMMVAGQQVALGRIQHHQTVTVLVSETTLAVQQPDADELVVRRTDEQPVRSIKESGMRPGAHSGRGMPRLHHAVNVAGIRDPSNVARSLDASVPADDSRVCHPTSAILGKEPDGSFRCSPVSADPLRQRRWPNDAGVGL
jgi:hypothetical protein